MAERLTWHTKKLTLFHDKSHVEEKSCYPSAGIMLTYLLRAHALYPFDACSTAGGTSDLPPGLHFKTEGGAWLGAASFYFFLSRYTLLVPELSMTIAPTGSSNEYRMDGATTKTTGDVCTMEVTAAPVCVSLGPTTVASTDLDA